MSHSRESSAPAGSIARRALNAAPGIIVSSVASAGQYIVGLLLETIARYTNIQLDEGTKQAIKTWGSVLIACGITLYFFRQNLIGIHESSDKALKIMIATTVMAVVMLIWSG